MTLKHSVNACSSRFVYQSSFLGFWTQYLRALETSGHNQYEPIGRLGENDITNISMSILHPADSMTWLAGVGFWSSDWVCSV